MKKIIMTFLLLLSLMAFSACSPNDTQKESKSICSVVVDCSDILNEEGIEEEKLALIPDDGIIFKEESVVFADGETVFDVLKRELINANVHMEFATAPVYNTVYIKGIGNIYELDFGERSGWQYMVNGEAAMVACSDYILKDGDKVEFIYKRVGY